MRREKAEKTEKARHSGRNIKGTDRVNDWEEDQIRESKEDKRYDKGYGKAKELKKKRELKIENGERTVTV